MHPEIKKFWELSKSYHRQQFALGAGYFYYYNGQIVAHQCGINTIYYHNLEAISESDLLRIIKLKAFM